MDYTASRLRHKYSLCGFKVEGFQRINLQTKGIKRFSLIILFSQKNGAVPQEELYGVHIISYCKKTNTFSR